eukprot:5898463-Pleurochrysis_carterae.AAC.1
MMGVTFHSINTVIDLDALVLEEDRRNDLADAEAAGIDTSIYVDSVLLSLAMPDGAASCVAAGKETPVGVAVGEGCADGRGAE